MSISSALSNAVSGLGAASRSAEVVASNVANANTEGYGRRDVKLASAVVGGASSGVRVTGIERSVDKAAISDRRLADAQLGLSDQRASFFSRLESTIGVPDSANSLTGRMARFESSLIAASGQPQNNARLSEVLDAAKGVTSHLNTVSKTLQVARQDADAGIARSVDQLNSALQNVSDLNDKIRSANASGGSIAGLLDQRQLEIDRIGALVPIRELPRENGQVALMTSNGTTLLDGRPAKLSFNPSRTITAAMTVTTGALSQVEITQAGSLVGTAAQALAGGKIAGYLQTRDQDAVAAQSQIDAASRNLIERFSDPALDATLTAPPGLFTDRGAGVDPLTENGIAARISVNTAVDPAQGGQIWRIRDGIGAVAQGPVGNNALIEGYRAALDRTDIPASGNFAGARSSADLFSDILSEVGFSRQTADVGRKFAADQQTNLREIEQSGGVDTDQELQKLLLIEQSYAANAKIIQAVDDMLQSLLRI